MMSRITVLLPLLSLLSMVMAVCDFTLNSIAPTNKLSDLRTPTPWTFVDSYTHASCGNKPTTATVYITIYISGTAYPAASSEKYVMGAATTGTVAWVFPDLIVTNLLPGQVATVSWTAINGLNGGNVSAAFLMTVPKKITLTAVHPVTRSVDSTASSVSAGSSAASSVPSSTIASQASLASSSGSASATPTSSNSGSSAAIGGIVAGVVCGVVLITAILAFTYFKVKTHRDRQRDSGYHEMLDFDSATSKSINLAYPRRSYRGDLKMTIGEGEDGRAIPVRVPAESGNTSREY